MRSCDSDASMPPADSAAPGARPCGPSSQGAPAACGDRVHAQQQMDDSVPGQPAAAALDGMEVAAGQHMEVPHVARPAAAPAGSGGAAAIGSPSDAGVTLDDVDIAEQRRILQDIAVRRQDNGLSVPAVACSMVSASPARSPSCMELDAIDRLRGDS
jgi:hypothetical protein